MAVSAAAKVAPADSGWWLERYGERSKNKRPAMPRPIFAGFRDVEL